MVTIQEEQKQIYEEKRRGERRARGVVCPACHAGIGTSCVTASNRKRSYHTSRAIRVFKTKDVWIESAECATRVSWGDFVMDNEPDVVEETYDRIHVEPAFQP
jgi:hypothetical protein